MDTTILIWVIEAALGGAIGVISFFLKRTVDQISECEKEIVKIKSEYLAKEDFFREQTETRRKLDRIMDILLEMKGERGRGQRNN
ncbi:MAG: hypothetical protein Q4F95_00790 [Oscillospiraceae bacterium]|nr:hypothetical protein [Oscillospiraceae bacterium]